MGEAARRQKSGNYPAKTPTITLGIRPRNTATNFCSTTPAFPLSDHVIHFARSLSKSEPVAMAFTDMGSGYISGACHLNVAHRVKHHGGERVSGWMIWTSIHFTEAEFHSVWRSPSGELVDVTPRVDGEQIILFVPDPNTKFEARGEGGMMPSNRTTIPGAPYTASGLPSVRFSYREPDGRTRQHMAKLGLHHFTGGVA